ncbi:MAG: hypothetical protein PHU70_02075 [Dehalococcoidia bacterium]|nr:hypothetical protein [Dehalococcoidia bacterium]
MSPVTASLIQLVPFSELAEGEAASIRNRLIEKLVALASRELSMAPEKLVVRDIRAKEDLALYSAGADADVEDWGCVTGSSPNAYETMATGSMATNRYMGFFGVKCAVDAFACTALKINTGEADRAIWQLECLKPEDGMVGFSPGGVIIPQNSAYTISRYVRKASSAAYILLKGIIVEPRGRVVSP